MSIDLDAYFKRIGYAESREPTLEHAEPIARAASAGDPV